MNVETARLDAILLVKPRGRIDHTNANILAAELKDLLDNCNADGDKLLFDFSDLEYISSAGLRVLMVVSKKTRPEGGEVVMAAPNDLVREIIEISHFEKVFPLYATVDEGLAALDKAANH